MPDRLFGKPAGLILLGAGLGMFCAQPAAILFTYSLFAPAVAAERGWSPAVVAAAIGPAVLVGALLAPLCGRVADMLGARRVVLAGGPAYTLGFLLLAYGPTHFWQFATLLAVLCGLGFAATPLLYAQIVAGWFVEKRGLALSLAFSCTSLGIAAWPPLATYLIDQLGWPGAYASIGLATGTIITLSALLLLRESWAAKAPRRQAIADAGVTLAGAVRGKVFWVLAGCFALLTTVLFGLSVHLPTLLRLGGTPPSDTGMVLAVTGVASFVGRLSTGIMIDRWFAPRITAAILLLSILAVSLLATGGGERAIFVAAMLLGFSLGAELDLAAYLISRAFGQVGYGAIFGAITLVFGLASAAGPAAVGYALAGTVPAGVLFTVGGVMLVAATTLTLTLRPSDFLYGGSANT